MKSIVMNIIAFSLTNDTLQVLAQMPYVGYETCSVHRAGRVGTNSPSLHLDRRRPVSLLIGTGNNDELSRRRVSSQLKRLKLGHSLLH
jgi:hypothetical protein